MTTTNNNQGVTVNPVQEVSSIAEQYASLTFSQRVLSECTFINPISERRSAAFNVAATLALVHFELGYMVRTNLIEMLTAIYLLASDDTFTPNFSEMIDRAQAA